MNPLKHGLQAEQVVIPGEDPEEFEALLRGLKEHYHPVGALEDSLVERVAHCTWRLQRAGVIETAIMCREHLELEGERASEEAESAASQMNWVARQFDYDPNEDQSDDDDSDEDHNLPPEKAEALWRDYRKAEESYRRAKEARDRAEKELEGLFCAVDKVFWRTEHRLERLSRYETTIARQLRHAMQDLERLQTAREAKAAATATVIDIKDLNEEEN